MRRFLSYIQMQHAPYIPLQHTFFSPVFCDLPGTQEASTAARQRYVAKNVFRDICEAVPVVSRSTGSLHVDKVRTFFPTNLINILTFSRCLDLPFLEVVVCMVLYHLLSSTN